MTPVSGYRARPLPDHELLLAAFDYNAGTGEYGDMIDAGILDPAKVTRLALQNAASVAGLLLTTEVMIAEAPKDDEHAHGAPGGGMGGMGGMDM